MKIMVATMKGGLDDQVAPVFGRCTNFTVIEADKKTKKIKKTEIISNTSAAARGGAGIQAAQSAVDKGVEAVIAGNFGPNAFRVLAAGGVKIVQAQGNVKEIVEKYLKGELKPLDASTVSEFYGTPGAMLGRGQGGAGRGMGLGGMGRGRGGGRGGRWQQ